MKATIGTWVVALGLAFCFRATADEPALLGGPYEAELGLTHYVLATERPVYQRGDDNPLHTLVGECTWFVHAVWPFELPTTGDAHTYLDWAREHGYAVGTEPRIGAIAVWGPSVGPGAGHVALVTMVDGPEAGPRDSTRQAPPGSPDVTVRRGLEPTFEVWDANWSPELDHMVRWRRVDIGDIGLLGFVYPPAAVAGDRLAFVRDGRVWLATVNPSPPVPGQNIEQRPLTAPDPGWVYALPTWIDNDRLLVMRLRNGEAGRSHVGILTVADDPTKPEAIRWLPALGGSYCIGINHTKRQLSFVKVRRHAADGWYDVYLGAADLDGRRTASELVDGACDPKQPDTRIRWSLDGRSVVVPSFPCSMDGRIHVYDFERHKVVVDRPWMLATWSGGAESCWAYGPDGLFVFGTEYAGGASAPGGLYKAATHEGLVQHVAERCDRVYDVSLSSDASSAYYEMSRDVGDESVPEIRCCSLAQERSPVVVLRNASSPDCLLSPGTVRAAGIPRAADAVRNLVAQLPRPGIKRDKPTTGPSPIEPTPLGSAAPVHQAALAYVTDRGSIRVFDADSRVTWLVPYQGSFVTSVEWTADGKELLIADEQGIGSVNPETEEHRTLVAHARGDISALAPHPTRPLVWYTLSVSASPGYLAVRRVGLDGSGDRELRRWESNGNVPPYADRIVWMGDGESAVIGVEPTHGPAWINLLRLGIDGSELPVPGPPGDDEGAVTDRLKGLNRGCTPSWDFTQNVLLWAHAVSSRFDEQILVLDVLTLAGQRRHRLRHRSDGYSSIYSCQICPGRTLFAYAAGSDLIIWDWGTGKEVWRLRDPHITTFAWRPSASSPDPPRGQSRTFWR